MYRYLKVSIVLDSHHCGLCLVRGPPGRPGGVPGPTGGTRRLELRVDSRENLHASLICNGGGVARYGAVMPCQISIIS